MAREGPLGGTVVLDVTRMVPGAVMARMLLDLGARVIKVEGPGGGDPLRGAPPLVGGVGAAFAAFYRGAESLCLDLKDPAGDADLRRLARHADVLAESFRPGTMARWGVGTERLALVNPALVVCSLSGYGAVGPHAAQVGHDLNLVAVSGLLSLLPDDSIPKVPFADVAGGLLAFSAVLAALLARARTGRGCHIDQPLSVASLPFVTWNLAELSAGGGGLSETLLAGAFPAYRLYRCADGARVALCALEPKFWEAFLQMVGLEDLSAAGLDPGPAGGDAARRVQAVLEGRPRAHWVAMARDLELPLSPVLELSEAASAAESPTASFYERTPAPGGAGLLLPGPFLPSLGRTPGEPAPALGQHTAALRREFGLD